MNTYEKAILSNADWLLTVEDDKGFIAVPADEYYGVEGDASLIGHAVSVRTWAWVLSGESRYRESAHRSLVYLAERQDPSGGWHNDAGYSLDAAQCVFEGYCTYERLTGDRQFHEVLVKAADRMITGTIDEAGELKIKNVTEVGEYAHFAFLAWKQTGLERHLHGAHAILNAIMASFDKTEGYWNTAVEGHSAIMDAVKPCVTPLLRACIQRSNLKGKTVAKISEHILPLVMRGHGPQYALGMMDAESLLDTLDGSMKLPGLREQTARAIDWVETHCAGPMPGSLCESKAVKASEAVYPIAAINDAENASLWPTAAYLLALVGMNDSRAYGERARVVADWIVSMQDEDGGFRTHQDAAGRRFGGKYGNINFYASLALWWHNAIAVRGQEPSR